VVAVEYQRSRFMLPARVSVFARESKIFELLFPVLVVLVPVQLSPPASSTPAPLCGSTSCDPQKTSVPVPLGRVMCPAAPKPKDGSQTS
jgi:hypothetical protein